MFVWHFGETFFFQTHLRFLILTRVLNDSSVWSGISRCIVRQREANGFDVCQKINKSNNVQARFSKNTISIVRNVEAFQTVA